MTRPLWLGTIAEKDGLICLQTGANVWYPLNGNSGIAEKFRLQSRGGAWRYYINLDRLEN